MIILYSLEGGIALLRKKKKLFYIFNICIFCVSLLAGCNSGNTSQEASKEKDIPTINMAWDFDLHGAVMLSAAIKGEDFKDSGIWLKPIIEKEQYGLYKDGNQIAIVNTIVTKGSSESAVMLGQKQLDCALNSVTGMLSAKDQGTDIKVLSPIHVDGIGLVFPKGTDLHSWGEVENYIKGLENPLRIGYHSPTSAPRVVIETALKQANIKVTEDPNDRNAEVLLVDLKGSKNLLSAFTGDQVDAWVAPSHYPEAAEAEGIGSIALNLNQFPPEGQWYDFPCCVLAARGDVLEKHPEVFDALVDLFTYSAKWCTENKEEASTILADIIGVPKEAVSAATIVYTTQVSDKWEEGVELYYDLLQDLGKFDGDLQGGSFKDIKEDFFYFDFINN